MSRIVLKHREQTHSYDEAGVSITKSVISQLDIPRPPYGDPKPPKVSRGVPSLFSLCIHHLWAYPHIWHTLGPRRIRYLAGETSADDVLRFLVPQYCRLSKQDFSLSSVDPRLWAGLVQLYSGTLPDHFRTYTMALSDSYLPELQEIPASPYFTLLTVLELYGCNQLTDESIVALKELHLLSALDAGRTSLTAYGLTVLARCQTRVTADHDASTDYKPHGPWRLRILSLRDCPAIDGKIFRVLQSFKLLSVVDVRGTKCTRNSAVSSGNFLSPANASARASYFPPVPMSAALENLRIDHEHSTPGPNPTVYTLQVNRLHYARDTIPQLYPFGRKPKADVLSENTYVVFTKNEPGSQYKVSSPSSRSAGPSLMTGNLDLLARRVEIGENASALTERQIRRLHAIDNARAQEERILMRPFYGSRDDDDDSYWPGIGWHDGLYSSDDEDRNAQQEHSSTTSEDENEDGPLTGQNIHATTLNFTSLQQQSANTSTAAASTAPGASTSEFYHNAQSSRRLLRVPLERNLGDERLCLFRPPPPWDTVDKDYAINTPLAKSKKKSSLPVDDDDIVPAIQTGKRPGAMQNPMQGVIDNLLVMKRRRMDEAVSAPPSNLNTQDAVSNTTQPLSRNPFRRK